MKDLESNIFKTEIIKGKEDILKRVQEVIQDSSENLDVCLSSLIVQDSSDINYLLNSYKEAYRRGVKVRYITNIRRENLLFIKKFMSISKVRHLSNVIDVFVISEKEILYNIVPMSSEDVSAPFLYSKAKEISKAQKHIFENLWTRAKDIKEEKEEIKEQKESDTYFKHVKSLTRVLELFKKDGNKPERLDIYLPRLEFNNTYSKYLSEKFNSSLTNEEGLINRNIRYISTINKNNVRYAEKLLDNGIKIRHSNKLPPLNFILSDYMVSIFMDPFFINNGSPQNIIITNEAHLVKQYKKVFEDLWNRGLEGSLRVNDVKSYLERGREEYEEEEFTEIIENTHKTQDLLLKLISNAAFEVLLILPSVNAFLREYNLKIWETINKRATEKTENTIKSKFYFRVPDSY